MIAIIGAGITGLVLAHELAARGAPFVVFEATDRPGGVIRSEERDGHLLEYGPQRTRLVGSVRSLVEELGIGNEVITAPPDLPLYVYWKGRLRAVPFSAGEFLRSDLFGWGSKFRALAEPLTGGARNDERVAAYFVRKFGREVHENMLGPLYGGLYASDPEDMVVGLSLGHVLRELGVGRSLLVPLLRRGARISPPAAVSFRKGMGALPDALYRRYSARIRLGTPARRIEERGEGFAIHSDEGTLDADRVVITAPAPAAAELLREIAPATAASIDGLYYNPLAIVHLLAETELRGLGYQTSLAEDLATRGVTWNDSLFGRAGVYTAYLGGARAPAIVDEADASIGATAVREFREVTGYTATVISVARQRMPAWDVSWAALEGLSLPPGIEIAANWRSRPGLPGRIVEARRLAAQLTSQA